MTYGELETRYRWQFAPGRGIDRCTPPDWLPVLANLMADIEAILPAGERRQFAWSDVKEKRGRLAVDYIAPTAYEGAIEAAIDTAILRINQI